MQTEKGKKIKITETYNEFFKQKPFWKLKNTSAETGVKVPNVEAALSVNFRGQMAPISTEFQHPAEPLLMNDATKGCEVICG